MQIDYQSPHQWLRLNHHIADRLNIKKEKNEVRIYKELSHALWEILWGLVQLFPHKPKAYFFKDMNPYFDFPMRGLKLENIKVKALDLKTLEEGKDILNQLTSEDLFLLYSEDDPILGKKFPIQNLEKTFSHQTSSQKNLFLISISHNTHYYNQFYLKQPLEEPSKNLLEKSSKNLFEIKPYSIYIHSFGSKGALAFLGSRARRIKSPLASELFWNVKEYEKIEKELKKYEKINKPKELERNKEKILNFEKTQVCDFKPFFSSNCERIYDKAVIYWEDMDGYAFIHELSKKLERPLLPHGIETHLETTSLSRWNGGLTTMDWLQAYGLSMNQIRGLVMIDSSLIDENLPEIINDTRKKILKLQLGSSIGRKKKETEK